MGAPMTWLVLTNTQTIGMYAQTTGPYLQLIGNYAQTIDIHAHGTGTYAPTNPFFSALDTPPPKGAGLPACHFGNSGCPQQNHPPPPNSGLGFLGKMFVSKFFIWPLSSGLLDLVSTLAVLCYICAPKNLGSNPGRWGI